MHPVSPGAVGGSAFSGVVLLDVGRARGRLSRVGSAVTLEVPRPGRRCLRGAFSVNSAENAPSRPGRCRRERFQRVVLLDVGRARGRLRRVGSAVTLEVPRPGRRCLRGAFSVNSAENAPSKPGRCRGRRSGQRRGVRDRPSDPGPEARVSGRPAMYRRAGAERIRGFRGVAPGPAAGDVPPGGRGAHSGGSRGSPPGPTQRGALLRRTPRFCLRSDYRKNDWM